MAAQKQTSPQRRQPRWNINTFSVIIAIYLGVIVLSWIYFVVLQQFGAQGLVFSIAGEDQVFNAFDIVLVAATVASFFLVVISLLAFRRRKDNRIFILSVAFFLFAVSELLLLFENFFPAEHIFVNNAGKVLDLLILLSFAMLLYPRK